MLGKDGRHPSPGLLRLIKLRFMFLKPHLDSVRYFGKVDHAMPCLPSYRFQVSYSAGSFPSGYTEETQVSE